MFMIRKEMKRAWRPILLCLLLAALLAAAAGCAKTAPTGSGKGEDLVIPVKEVTETAAFYPVEIEGVKLEVLAVKGSDGEIHTAFNTCQVCFDSGKGYYKQEGNELVCQNCKNRFSMNQVGKAKGGCNPVPVPSEFITETDESITVSYDILTEAKEIFENWKA